MTRRASDFRDPAGLQRNLAACAALAAIRADLDSAPLATPDDRAARRQRTRAPY